MFLSDVACMKWLMGWIWWVWCDFGMEYEWRLVI